MDRDPRPTGVKLRLLNTDRIAAQAGAHAADGTTYDVGLAPWAAVEHGGRLYAICHEGVGYEVDEDRPLELPVYKQVEGHISIFPTFTANLSPDEVRELMTDTEVDLADHIRRFGSRLEDNFWALYRILSKEA